MDHNLVQTGRLECASYLNAGIKIWSFSPYVKVVQGMVNYKMYKGESAEQKKLLK